MNISSHALTWIRCNCNAWGLLSRTPLFPAFPVLVTKAMLLQTVYCSIDPTLLWQPATPPQRSELARARGRAREGFLRDYVIVTPQKCIPKETSAPPYILAREESESQHCLVQDTCRFWVPHTIFYSHNLSYPSSLHKWLSVNLYYACILCILNTSFS